MPKYIVIAGAVPAVHKRRIVQPGELLDEDFFMEGEIGDLVKGQFIEPYSPHVLTDDDIKANPNLEKHEKLKAGDEIHKQKRGFKPANADVEEPTKNKKK